MKFNCHLNYYLVLSFFFYCCLSHATELKEVQDFGLNPGNLKLFTYNTTAPKNKAVVFVLHGCSQNASDIELLSEWQKLADKNNFSVFYPQQKMINNLSSCFNWFLESDINKNGESLSIYHMMRYAIDSLKADSTQLFFYGVSAGACMAEVMCANYPWLVNTAVICAGIPYKTATGIKALGLMGKPHQKTEKEWGDLVRNQNTFYTGKYPRIIVVHGTKDKIANYGYANEIIKQWTNANGIKNSSPNEVIKFEGNERVSRINYNGANGKEVVVFYSIKDMGHELPVDVGSGEKQGGKEKLFSKDIDFFLTYYLIKDFGLIH